LRRFWLQQAGSVVVWDLFPFARFIQFPYRLSVDVTILGALLLGAFVAAPRNSGPAPGRPLGRQIVWLAGLILGSSAIGVLLVTSLWSIPRTRTAFEESQVSLPMLWRLEADRQLFAGSTQGDYLPAGIVGSFFDLAARRDELFGSTAGADLAGSLTILQSDPLSLVARVASPRAVTLTFDRFAYAAWQAAIDGQAAPVRAQAPLDLVQVAVPAGNHLLTLDASGGFADRFGLAVSIVGGLVLIGLAMRHLPRNSRPKGWLLWLAVSIALATGMAVALGSQVEPPRALAGGVDFGRAGVASVRLVGSSLNLASRTPDGAIDLTLFWEARNSPLPSCEVHLRLLDDTGTVVARRDKEPLFGLRPCSTWATNEIIRDEEQIRLPPAGAAQPWRLALSMTLGDQALVPVTSADLLSWHDPGALPTEDMVGILLGSLPAGSGPPMRSMAELASPGSFAVGAILAGRSQLESTAIQVGTTELKPAEPNQVRAGGSAGPALSGSSRLAPSVLPDDVLHLRLVWRALRDVSTDYSVFTHVTDSTGNLVAQDDAWPDRYNFPTSVWFPGDSRVDDYELKLTKAVPGIYQITVGMYERPSLNRLPVIGDPAGGGEIVLGRFKVSRPDQVFGESRSVEPQDDVFGGQIALAGHHVAATAPLSTSLVVDLAWRAIRRPTNDFTVFVHLLDQAGKLVGQQDGPPQAGRFPTSWWDPGDTIYDRISIPLPSGLAPGSYQLEVGLYRPDTGERLAVVDATGQRLADRVIFPGPTVR
jgi:hypothetical protein